VFCRLGIVVALLCGTAACGQFELHRDGQLSGGGQGIGLEGTRDSFGFHLFPQLAKTDDYNRAARIGGWAVIDIPLQFWHGPEAKDVRASIDACAQRGLRCLIRLEDQYIVTTAPADRRRSTDDAWFDQVFAPYVREVVKYGKDRVWGYQVLNEPWYPQWQVYGPTGSPIQPAEYIDLLKRTREVIHALEPGGKVVMAGLQGIATPPQEVRAEALIRQGVLEHSDVFNFHFYTDGRFTRDVVDRLDRFGELVGDHPSLITESNHLRIDLDAFSKYVTLTAIGRQCRVRFKNLIGQLAFAWRSNDAWQIKDTPLEDLLHGKYATRGLPRGALEKADTLEIKGWALDPDAGIEPIDVHIYLDGHHVATVRADEPRPELHELMAGFGREHGFSWKPSTVLVTPGKHKLDVYAINVPTGVNAPIGTTFLDLP
jgi:hypothetical protein